MWQPGKILDKQVHCRITVDFNRYVEIVVVAVVVALSSSSSRWTYHLRLTCVYTEICMLVYGGNQPVLIISTKVLYKKIETE